EEEGPESADSVIGVVAVEPGFLHASFLECGDTLLGVAPQLGELAELDRLGRASLRAGGLEVVLQPVVTERALPHAPVAPALVENAERARDPPVDRKSVV